MKNRKTETIIRNADASMRMEGITIKQETKDNVRRYLNGEISAELLIKEIGKKNAENRDE
ncbi:MAG: antitoxin VbhA family protein [Flexilinea sp.]